ncbi:ANTAR domain-containing protein [Curtobacterium sp. MCSS17_005]|uniref:ANTAR domain-containing protein n=1 Tax=Curtobacterium sp. MCSS17_005 TaxID=2175641 RepID=UPI0011B4423C|nr:ANTAR domain-containing protein [Curtobacterium sp. MCSS17_005]WIB33090.1 ANTAR domain-containing protein [Curtobacterium sp. MCSS17_005]WIB34344.1 ANTAR domain-containing protein [Curtobacterium sp. MCSS17_005]
MNELRSSLTPLPVSLPDADLAAPFLDVVHGDGASVASFGDFAGNASISITDSRAGGIDRLQFDLDEGPCWDALQHDRPVLEPDVHHHPTNRWPAFLAAAADDGVGALFAVPLRFGPFLLGAADVYARTPMQVPAADATAAMTLAAAVSRRVLRHVLTRHDDGAPLRLRERAVHQAAGVVLAQVGLAPTDAYLLIRGHAAARNETVAETAGLILDRELVVTPAGDLVAPTVTDRSRVSPTS